MLWDSPPDFLVPNHHTVLCWGNNRILFCFVLFWWSLWFRDILRGSGGYRLIHMHYLILLPFILLVPFLCSPTASTTSFHGHCGGSWPDKGRTDRQNRGDSWRRVKWEMIYSKIRKNKGRLRRKRINFGTSLVVHWLRLHTPNAGALGSIPSQGIRSHMPQLRPSTVK